MKKGCDTKACPNPDCAAKKDPKAKCDCKKSGMKCGASMKCGANMEEKSEKKCGANK